MELQESPKDAGMVDVKIPRTALTQESTSGYARCSAGWQAHNGRGVSHLDPAQCADDPSISLRNQVRNHDIF
jgi:hypothetical protein